MGKTTTVTHLSIVIKVIKNEKFASAHSHTHSSSPAPCSFLLLHERLRIATSFLHSTPSCPHFFFSTLHRHHCKTSPSSLTVGHSHRIITATVAPRLRTSPLRAPTSPLCVQTAFASNPTCRQHRTSATPSADLDDLVAP